MTRIRLVALTAVALLGLGACGSDSTTSGGDVTLPGGTLPGGGTLPNLDTVPDLSIPDLSIPDLSLPDEILPENLTEECQAIAMQLAVVMSQVFAPSGEQTDVEQMFGDLSSKVPSELRADVQVLGEAFATYAEVVKAANNDFTDPDVQAALEALDTPEVQAANGRVTAYFDATCPQG